MQPNPCIWSSNRRPRSDQEKAEAAVSSSKDERSIYQQDYDRLLFSTPVRRLSDKTQVWPMDENDGVRTRLTHSHEVANLARSIGSRVFKKSPGHFKKQDGENLIFEESIQPLLLAIGLGHDLGNPPFGHQGEAAIGHWFDKRKEWIFTLNKIDGEDLLQPVPEMCRTEFTNFDGNPQSLRLLAKLQTHIDGVGLDLSAATLIAGLKYPVHYSKIDKNNTLAKKGGYFESEKDVVDWMRKQTGLQEGQRHPLTWIMEACDDIAYSVLDVDDVLKKAIISPDDVLAFLSGNQDIPPKIITKLQEKFKAVDSKKLNFDLKRDIKIQYLRAIVIEALIEHASNKFVSKIDLIFSFDLKEALMDESELCNELKRIAHLTAFNHPSVLKMEAVGAVAIDGLMTEIWNAITNRKKLDEFSSKRLGAREKYIYSLISPNYIEELTRAENIKGYAGALRYRELRLLTDMVSGMTDTFAMRLWKNVSSIPYEDRT